MSHMNISCSLTVLKPSLACLLMGGLALFIWLSEVQLEDFFNKVMDIQELLLSWALKTDVQLNL